jgi:hypothetical protein
MLNKVKDELYQKVKKNIVDILVVIGVLSILVGSLLPSGYSHFFLSVGSAILGAGTFSALMKTSFFAELFQGHIATAFYDPAKISDDKVLDRWGLITKSLLDNVLTKASADAKDRIQKLYFDGERQFHFEDLLTDYRIEIHEQTREVTITNTSRATIIVAPDTQEPMIKQTIKVQHGGAMMNSTMKINNKLVDRQKHTTESAEQYDINIPIYEYCEQGKQIKYERITVSKQNIDNEPYIAMTLVRYTMGLTVTATITDGYKIIFLPELEGSKCCLELNGKSSWSLASPQELLLPGQGYTMIITKLTNSHTGEAS